MKDFEKNVTVQGCLHLCKNPQIYVRPDGSPGLCKAPTIKPHSIGIHERSVLFVRTSSLDLAASCFSVNGGESQSCPRLHEKHARCRYDSFVTPSAVI